MQLFNFRNCHFVYIDLCKVIVIDRNKVLNVFLFRFYNLIMKKISPPAAGDANKIKFISMTSNVESAIG